MLIEGLVFHEFMVWGGTQPIRFDFDNDTDQRNITLILSPNNSGKTSIIRAIEFLLYGVEDARLKNLPSFRYVEALGPGEAGESYVEAVIRSGEERLRIRRTIYFSRKGKGRLGENQGGQHVVVADQKLTVFKFGDGGDTFVRNPEEKLATLVPREMFDFYFFKGEELANTLLKPGRTSGIPSQLKQVLYQREWASVYASLKKAHKKFADELGTISEQKDKYLAQRAVQNRLEKDIEGKKKELQGCEKDLKAAETSYRDLDKKIEGLSAKTNPLRKNQLEKTNQQLAKAEKELATLEERRRDQLGESSALMLASAHADTVGKLLEKEREAGVFPPAIADGILQQVLQKWECICGRPYEEGSEAHQALLQIREKSLTKAVEDNVWALINECSPTATTGFVVSATRERKQIEEYRERFEDLVNVEVPRLKEEKEGLEAQENPDAEREKKLLTIERVKVAEARQKQENAIREHKTEIQRQTISFNRGADKLRDLGRGTGRATYLGKAVEYSEKLMAAAERAERNMESTIHRELQKNVSGMYEEIVTDGSSAVIDEITLLPSIQRAGVNLPSGGGQDQVLVLCYLIALAQLRKEINGELRDRFAVSKFKEQAFFMDSVYGQMQGAYSREVSAELPKHMKQLVLLLAGQQWHPDIYEGLGNFLTNAYTFTLHSPKPVKNPKDFIFSIAGEEYDLLRRVSENEQAYATISDVSEIVKR